MIDALNLSKINALPQPLTAQIRGNEWPIFDIEVSSALARIDVMNQLECISFSEISVIVDADGQEHDPDTFWSDFDGRERR